jgi:hypothetical protein
MSQASSFPSGLNPTLYRPMKGCRVPVICMSSSRSSTSLQVSAAKQGDG